MKSIYKYSIPENKMDLFSLSLPTNAEILAVQIQYDLPCIWAVVEIKDEVETRWFKVIGTGHKHKEIEADKYIGTFQLLNGAFVGHLFETSLVLG